MNTQIKEIYQDEAVRLSTIYDRLLFTWSTGVGKSKAFIMIQQELKPRHTVIVVAERAHIKNWKAEYVKWGAEDLLSSTDIFCYASLKNHTADSCDLLCLDEAHHISPARSDMLITIHTKKVIALTATMNLERRTLLENTFGRFKVFNVSLREAIKKDILPVPQIHVIPLELDSQNPTETYVISKGQKTRRVSRGCTFSQMDSFLRSYSAITLTVRCTPLQKYGLICKDMDSAKNLFMVTGQNWAKLKWLNMGSIRKRFIAEQKTARAKALLNTVRGHRFICFCGSIQQANALGGKTDVIHSKKSDSQLTIDKFNEKKIDSLFAVNMLQEGQNLKDIEIGVLVQLDGEPRSFIQRMGRILRAENPVVYILYLKGTRDREFLETALECVDKSYITYE